MALLPFTRKHLALMRVKADATEIAAYPNMGETLESIGAKTIFSADGKTVLGVVGAHKLLPHVAEVFVLATEDQKDYPVTFAKCVRKELYTLKAKYRRIQATSICDSFHERWLTWLGFEREGVMKSYGLNGEDMTIWGLV